MSLLTESNLIDRVNRRIHNAKAKLGGDTAMRSILNDANRDLRLDMDLISAKRTSNPFIVYSDIYEYSAPTDLDYDKAVKFVPQEISLQGQVWEKLDHKYFFQAQNPLTPGRHADDWLLNSAFDNNLEEGRNYYAIVLEDGSPYIMMRTRIAETTTAKIVQTSEVTSTAGGTWTTTGDGTNLRADNQIFKTDSASLAYDSSGSTTAVNMLNSTFTAVDISGIADKGVVHFWQYLPSTQPASITANWGSSSGNIWTKTITARKNGLSFREGWNLLEFDWADLTSETGTPASTAVDYFLTTCTNSVATALKDYRIDEINARTGKQIAMEYYTKFIVKTTAGVYQEDFSLASDTTALEGLEVNALITKASMIASEMLRETNDSEMFRREYMEQKEKLEARFPSQSDVEGLTYYRI